MLKIRYHKQYRKDLKSAIKQGLDLDELKYVVETIQRQEALPPKYKDHKLQNDKYFKQCRECHVSPDWLLVYRIEKKELILELIRLGSHSDLRF